MSAFGEIFLDDFVVGRPYTFGPYRVARQELLEFNQRWDPLPIHLDEAAARAQGHRGITASGQYTLCIKQLFLNQAPWCAAVIGALGFDEVRFPHPVYIDDDLAGTVVCTNTRASRSKPDRGIVTLSVCLYNQDEVTVLSYIDTVMFSRRTKMTVENVKQ
jgi:acyl dehydratase